MISSPLKNRPHFRLVLRSNTDLLVSLPFKLAQDLNNLGVFGPKKSFQVAAVTGLTYIRAKKSRLISNTRNFFSSLRILVSNETSAVLWSKVRQFDPWGGLFLRLQYLVTGKRGN